MIRAALLLALLAVAVILASRHRPEAVATWPENDDGVQPADPRPLALAWRSDNLESVSRTWVSGNNPTWTMT